MAAVPNRHTKLAEIPMPAKGTRLTPTKASEELAVDRLAQMVHLVRGEKVLLSFDLATLYGVQTKALNQAVQRNIERFPEDFMFQLSKEEAEDLSRSQFVTLKRGYNIKKLISSPATPGKEMGFHTISGRAQATKNTKRRSS